MANEIIREFLEARVKAGQSEYEMMTDGYNGDFEAYAADYADDYKVVTKNGETVIKRVGYDEYYTVTGEKIMF